MNIPRLSKKISSLYGAGYSFPLMIKHRASSTPWQLYQKIYPTARYSFFLDSLDYNPPAQRYSYIGWKPYRHWVFEEKNPNFLSDLRRLLFNAKTPPDFHYDFFTGGAVGYWGYELAEQFEKISLRPKKGPAFPKLELLLIRDLIVFDHKEEVFYLISWLFPAKGVSAEKVFRDAQEKIGEMEAAISGSNGGGEEEEFHLLDFRPEISKSEFERMVQRAQSYIAAGDIYQANLSQRFSFGFQGSPLKLYDRLRQTNPSPYSAFLRFGDLVIASSSPELLIEKKGSRCITRPIAGTRPRGRSLNETRRLVHELATDEKEKAEHLMLVDLERNDLGRVSEWKSVQVKDFMKIEKYARVMHLVSEIQGRMAPTKDAWDLIRAMFPGGTITGCPKIRSMEIIDELEPVRRGIYTGSIGYVGFDGNLMLNIVIRTLVLLKDRGYLQVGAGIVADSNPSREYEETLHKGEALAEALVSASFTEASSRWTQP